MDTQSTKVIKGYVQTAQRCPFCGMLHPLCVKGLVYVNQEKMNDYAECADRGYSFCNCKNIFFTDWKNIDQSMYGHDYSAKYNQEDTALREVATDRANKYLDLIPCVSGELFFEIGSANPYVLDAAKKRGFKTAGLDINPNSVKSPDHDFIFGDVENKEVSDKIQQCDIIWAAHVFEHFHYPLEVAKTCFNKLNSKGRVVISMPDPYFIPWSNPKLWGNWMIREHHIMWDMDSFIDELIAIGFELELAKRNVDKFFGSGDYTIIMRKP